MSLKHNSSLHGNAFVWRIFRPIIALTNRLQLISEEQKGKRRIKLITITSALMTSNRSRKMSKFAINSTSFFTNTACLQLNPLTIIYR
jgi:hypothetical protein